jgi:RNA polymerase sigma-70 factor (ECF subfamily)
VHDRAFLVILESMTPAERVSFLLHDVFEHPPPTSLPSWVARLKPVDSSPLRRACGFGEPSRSPVPTAKRARLARSFKQAWEAKDIDALIGLLDPSATAVADGGGHVTAALQPVEGGAQIAGRLIDLAGHPATVNLMERTVNGEPGPVAVHEGTTVGVYAFEVAEGRIQSIWIVFNPEKLRTWKGL